MSVPASKKSKASVRRRRSHMHVNGLNLGTCDKCKKPVLSHHACKNCGSYNGRVAVDTSRGTERALKKAHTHAPVAKDAKEETSK